MRVRWILPIIQMVVALGLTVSNAMGPIVLGDPRRLKPDKQLRDALNAPAALARFCLAFVIHHAISPSYALYFALEVIVNVSLVGAVWYIVAIELGGRGQSVLTQRTGMRKVADVLAIAFGACTGLTGLAVFYSLVPSAFSYFVAALWFLWSALIVGFYAHDLWISARGG